ELGTPDMKLPIQYALYYPDRKFLAGERLDFSKLASMTFEKPDTETFRGLVLAIEASRKGGSMPTVYNAANELAVAKFLDRKIKYLEIIDIIETCMGSHKVIKNPSIDEILEVEKAVYEMIEGRW
ncbi:MAG: 1-deoxy-D-xylulose-5-phosphate reductoisomerase, partial [Lachnospiraceae bacterium]|nr:1-deoxy-D-xylulose-5-phosphate reductoisomerase [Lachnospiraceae bacterium]